MTGSQGQDWASYQDWSPSTKGLAFVAIKVTESTGYTNPRYASQLAAARAAQLVVIHYHFARPGGMQAQADFFLRHTSLKGGDMLALDWEDTGVSSADKDTWIRYVQAKAPQHQVLLYCNRDFWINRDRSSFAGDGLWIADPDAPVGQPRIKAPWLIHQYSEAGGIDRDFCRLDPAALRAWAAGTPPTPNPAPQEDPLPQPIDIWAYRNATADAASVKAGHGHIPDAYAYLTSTNAAVKSLTAQVAALTATVGALAKGGGLTAEQITAAAKAGADEALAQLGHALDGTQP